VDEPGAERDGAAQVGLGHRGRATAAQLGRTQIGQMADVGAITRGETAFTSAIHRKDLAMTSSVRLTSQPTRSRRRAGAVALVVLAMIGAAVPAAYAEPDTNIQKPGHVLSS